MLAIALICNTVSIPKVGAILGNSSPDPTNVSSGGVQGAAGHLLKYEDVADIRVLKLGVYYPESHGSSGNGETFRIRYGNPGANNKKCFITPDIISQGGRIRVILDGGGTNNVSYNIPVANVCANLQNSQGEVRDNVKDGNANEDNNKFFADYKFPATMIDDRSSTGMYKLNVTIKYDGIAKGISMGNNVNFITSVSQPNAYIGTLGEQPENAFGFRSQYVDDEAANRVSVKVSAQFGIPCNVENSSFDVKFYDPDRSTFGKMWMWVTEDGDKLPRDRYGPDPTVDHADWDPDEKAWKVLGESEQTSRVVINGADKKHKYKFVYVNYETSGFAAPNGNVMSMGLPYDSVYGDVDCSYDLKPPTPITPNTYTYYPNITVQPSILKTGEGNLLGSHEWEVYVVRYSSKPDINLDNFGTDANPCTNHIPQIDKISGSCNMIESRNYSAITDDIDDFIYNIGGPDAVGTNLCFFSRIKNPTESNTDNAVWRYSNLNCAVSGVAPKIQVWGGDVKAGGAQGVTNVSIDTSTTRIVPENRTYGSWGEYGVLSNGGNVGMASGRGLVGGNPSATQFNWSKLTFSNSLFLGYYSGVQPLAYNPGIPTEVLANPGGICTLPARNYLANDRAVIYCDGTLTISGDQTYSTSLASIVEIPSVKIVARNVRVAPSVTKIDPWIIARASDGLYGSIYTCNGVTGNATNATCPSKLTINGPVLANSLYAFRTNDSATGDPAEVFNLRANNILSAYAGRGTSQPVARTELVTELPPRF